MPYQFHQPAKLVKESKKAPATTGAFAINTHKPFRKKILPVTHLDGIFCRHQTPHVAESKDFTLGVPPGGGGGMVSVPRVGLDSLCFAREVCRHRIMRQSLQTRNHALGIQFRPQPARVGMWIGKEGFHLRLAKSIVASGDDLVE